MNRWEESLKVSLDLIVARPEELLQYEEMLIDSFPPELGSGSYWPGPRSKMDFILFDYWKSFSVF